MFTLHHPRFPQNKVICTDQATADAHVKSGWVLEAAPEAESTKKVAPSKPQTPSNTKDSI